MISNGKRTRTANANEGDVGLGMVLCVLSCPSPWLLYVCDAWQRPLPWIPKRTVPSLIPNGEIFLGIYTHTPRNLRQDGTFEPNAGYLSC